MCIAQLSYSSVFLPLSARGAARGLIKEQREPPAGAQLRWQICHGRWNPRAALAPHFPEALRLPNYRVGGILSRPRLDLLLRLEAALLEEQGYWTQLDNNSW